MITRGILKPFSFIWIFFALMLSNCIPNNTESVSKVTPTLQNATNIVSTGAQPTPSTDFNKVQTTFTPQNVNIDLAFGFNYVNVGPCSFVNRDLIEVVSSHDMHISYTLTENDTDYKYPTWSSDGQWIAYIVSKPEIQAGLVSPIIHNGSDSIWIMKADGDDKNKVSPDLVSNLISKGLMCFHTDGIIGTPVWSPDSNYISFLYQRWNSKEPNYYYDYYLLDLSNRNMKLLYTDNEGYPPFWLNNNTIIFHEKTGVEVIGKIGTDKLSFSKIAYPNKILTEEFPPDFYLTQDKSLILSFPVFNPGELKNSQKTQLWKLEISSATWNKIAEVDGNGSLIIGNNGIAICDEIKNEIIVYNPINWQIIGNSIIPTEIKLSCSPFVIGKRSSTLDVGYITIKDGNKFRLYSINLQSGEQQLTLLLDSSAFSLPDVSPVVWIDVRK